MNKVEIENWLTLMNIDNYEIHEDLSVSVNDFVDIRDRELTHIPIQFNHVEGGFNCSYNFLRTLKGSPYTVNGNFNCKNNNLSSLEFAPKFIERNFNFSENKLKTLESFNCEVLGLINASYNFLYSLKGLPESLQGSLACFYNQIKNYEGMPKNIKDLYCDYSLLEDLNNLPEFVSGAIYILNRNGVNKDTSYVFDEQGERAFTLFELQSIRLKKSLEQSLFDRNAPIKKLKV